eukprot:CAMPEP_0175152852 /NCGR_PEP_ID=MMETSP0087-20121206/19371_1 /TAXON_ID=136419 /ORGANISM="Unknown Unknown, Strain D1" /LENGTH=331 /DNA_ID=CAMNT_0016439385 /DNA_START=22 /DNA_END=1017 /DNA_ORIENTATION=+
MTDNALTTTLPFLRACGTYTEGQVKAEISRGANVHEKDDQGNTALIHACFHVKTKIVQLLLKFYNDPIQINHQNNDGSTALHFAVIKGPAAQQIITLLVEAGADVKIQNKRGQSPLSVMQKLPAFKGNHPLARLFGLEGKAKPVVKKGQPKGVAGKKRVIKLDRMAANAEKEKNLKAIFEYLTKDQRPLTAGGEVYLAAENLRPIWKFLGLHLNEMDEKLLMGELDFNHDGHVNLEDFCKQILRQPPEESLKPKFAFDIPFAAFGHGGDINFQSLMDASDQLGDVFCCRSKAEGTSILRSLHPEIGDGAERLELVIDKDLFEQVATNKLPP